MPVDCYGTYRPHPEKVSKGRRAAVYVRDNWTCQYCGLEFTPGPDNLTGRYAPYIKVSAPPGQPYGDWVYLELDHVLPRKHGGTNDFDNLRAACTPCNKRKLATTRLTKWDVRIRLAQEALATGDADEATAKKAAALLLGYLVCDLPKVKGQREAGF